MVAWGVLFGAVPGAMGAGRVHAASAPNHPYPSPTNPNAHPDPTIPNPITLPHLPLLQGIRALDLSYDDAEQWPSIAFLLGSLRPALHRVSLSGAAGVVAELAGGHAGFLWTLRGLTSLDLDSAMGACLDWSSCL